MEMQYEKMEEKSGTEEKGKRAASTSDIGGQLTRVDSRRDISLGDNKYEDILDKFTKCFGLGNITLKKLDDNNFMKTLQDLLDATLSGRLFYLDYVRHILDKEVTSPV